MKDENKHYPPPFASRYAAQISPGIRARSLRTSPFGFRTSFAQAHSLTTRGLGRLMLTTLASMVLRLAAGLGLWLTAGLARFGSGPATGLGGLDDHDRLAPARAILRALTMALSWSSVFSGNRNQ